MSMTHGKCNWVHKDSPDISRHFHADTINMKVRRKCCPLLIQHINLYSAFFRSSAMPAQHTQSTGLLRGRPVALERSTR